MCSLTAVCSWQCCDFIRFLFWCLVVGRDNRRGISKIILEYKDDNDNNVSGEYPECLAVIGGNKRNSINDLIL